jgi:glycerophosphoryl diester phosphodiesterase
MPEDTQPHTKQIKSHTHCADALRAVKGYAHRGLHSAEHTALPYLVENSGAAIQSAVEAGVGIEIDVQMTGDGKAIVFHDETLERLTQRAGRVFDLPLRVLTDISYKSPSGNEVADKIISLEACLKLISGRVPLLIEVKSRWSGIEEMERHLCSLLSPYQGDYGVMSFDPTVISRMKTLMPQGCYGLVTAEQPDERWPQLDFPMQEAHPLTMPGMGLWGVQLEKARDLSIDFIAHDVSDPGLPAVAHDVIALGASLFCWTVRDDNHLAKVREVGALPIFEGMTF